MFRKLLRPFGYMGSLLIGGVIVYFFGDKIKEKVQNLTK